MHREGIPHLLSTQQLNGSHVGAVSVAPACKHSHDEQVQRQCVAEHKHAGIPACVTVQQCQQKQFQDTVVDC